MIEPGKYQGVDAEVPVIAVPNYLVVNASMDPDLAYEITKLLFERKKELTQVHPAAERTELETANPGGPDGAASRGAALLRRAAVDD